jgi:hypothetical protein
MDRCDSSFVTDDSERIVLLECSSLQNYRSSSPTIYWPVSIAMTVTSPLTPSPSSLPPVPPSPASSSSSYHEPVTTVIDSDSDSDFEIVGSPSSNAGIKKPAKKVAGRANAGGAGKRKVGSVGAGNARAGPSAGIKRQKTKTGKRANRANDGNHDDRDEDAPSASIPNRPHLKCYHDTTTLTPLLPDLLAWFEEVREKRKMPWRKRYDDSASIEAKGQRAYEVRGGRSGSCYVNDNSVRGSH